MCLTINPNLTIDDVFGSDNKGRPRQRRTFYKVVRACNQHCLRPKFFYHNGFRYRKGCNKADKIQHNYNRIENGIHVYRLNPQNNSFIYNPANGDKILPVICRREDFVAAGGFFNFSTKEAIFSKVFVEERALKRAIRGNKKSGGVK